MAPPPMSAPPPGGGHLSAVLTAIGAAKLRSRAAPVSFLHVSGSACSRLGELIRRSEELVANALGRHTLGPQPVHQRPQEWLWPAEKLCRLLQRGMLCQPIGADQ